MLLSYSLKKLPGGSERYGNCEHCNKAVDLTFHLVQLGHTFKAEGGQRNLHLLDKFGHKSCMAGITENPSLYKIIR
jgi:hypothetical protein